GNNIVGETFDYYVGKDETGEPYKQRIRIDSIESINEENYKITATNKVNGRKYEMIINSLGVIQAYIREGKKYEGEITDEISFPASADFGTPVIAVKKDFSKTIPPPNSEYRRIGGDVTRISDSELELFKEWHKENVPNIPYEVLENILFTHDGD